jgi:hypothetical protein
MKWTFNKIAKNKRVTKCYMSINIYFVFLSGDTDTRTVNNKERIEVRILECAEDASRGR